MKATDEQRKCLDAYNTGKDLRIDAVAGSGKTTTLRYLMVRGQSRGRVLYTSFGRKIVADAREKFPEYVDVRTNHSLAYRSYGVRWQERGRLQGRVTGYQLAKACGWSSRTFSPWARATVGANAVAATINAFCSSGDEKIGQGHVPMLMNEDGAIDAGYMTCVKTMAEQAWARMMDERGRIPITHDVYLKAWALSHPQLGYDVVLLDEAQDTSGLMIRLLAEQEHTQRIIVGDRYQQIYSWRGAVNAMRKFKVDVHGELTRSFRFGPAIAELAEAVLRKYAGATKVKIQGSEHVQSSVVCGDNAKVVLSRTNAALIGELADGKRSAVKDAVVGGIGDMQALLYGVTDLERSKRSSHPELLEFASWRSLVSIAKRDDAYAHLRPLVKMVNDRGANALLSELAKVKGNETDESSCGRVLSTAHKAKGREFDEVKLLDDFPVKGRKGSKKWRNEEGNVLYVAITRAKQKLVAGGTEAVMDAAHRAGLNLEGLTPAA